MVERFNASNDDRAERLAGQLAHERKTETLNERLVAAVWPAVD